MPARLPWILLCASAASAVACAVIDDTAGDGPTGDTAAAATGHTADTGSGPVVDSGTPGASWILGATIPCDDPGARRATPYTRLVRGEDWSGQPVDPDDNSLFVGGGIAVADLDDDGLLDLFATSPGTDATLWLQRRDAEGMWFEDASDRLPALPVKTTGATAVDVDDDGDLDLAVTRFRGPDLLLRHDGDAFVDVAAELGFAGGPEDKSMSSAWDDLDGDGDLDAFVAVYGDLTGPNGNLPRGDASHLFVRDADGFTDVVPDLPEDHALRKGHTFSGAFTDVDADGLPDLYVLNDFGWRVPTLLFRNVGGTLVDAASEGLELPRENMGLSIAHVDDDAIPDMFVTAWDTYALFTSSGIDGWAESGRAGGLTPDPTRGQHTAWGNQLGDLDHDGDLDAVVVYGHLPVRSANDNPQAQPDAVYVQQDGVWSDVAPAWGLDQDGRGRGVVLADLDGNGFLDLVRTDLRGPLRVDLATCGSGAWLVIDVRGTAPNRYGIGTEVVVLDGDRTWRRRITAGGTSYGSAGPPEVHVGLGDRDTVDRIEIHWPDGTTSVRDDVPTRRRVRVTR